MKNFFQKTSITLGLTALLALSTMVGCSKQPSTTGHDYEICNLTSKGGMSETESGYFYLLRGFVYYADKSDLSNWVVVCNNPDCQHDTWIANARGDCNGYISESTRLIEKDEKLYYYLHNIDSIQGDVYEFTKDGSGSTKVFTPTFPDYTRFSGGNSMFTEECFVVTLEDITEEGYRYKQILRLNNKNTFDTIYYGVYPEDESASGDDFISKESPYYDLSQFSLSGYLYVGGDSVLVTGNFIHMNTMKLWRVDGDYVEQVNLPSDVNISGSYLTSDTFTHYEANKGFFEIDLATGTETCIATNSLQNGIGRVLSENYLVEYNPFNTSPDACIHFFDGTKWIQVPVPDEVKSSENGFYPEAVSSDKVFFRQSLEKGYLSRLYYFSLDDKKPQFTFCSEIGKSPYDEEESSSSNNSETANTDESTIANEDTTLESITVFDNNDVTFKLTDAYQDGDSYKVEVYWDVKTDRNYMIRMTSSINGIQCDHDGFFMSMGEKEAQEQAEEAGDPNAHKYEMSFDGGEIGELTRYHVSDVYDMNEFTDLGFSFYMVDFNTMEVIDTKKVHFYPFGEEHVTRYTRKLQNTDTVLLDNEKVRIIATGTTQNTVDLLIENKTPQDVSFHIPAVFANGVMPYQTNGIDDFAQIHIEAGNCAFSTIAIIDDSFLQSNNIAQVETFTFLMEAFVTDSTTQALTDEKIMNDVFTVNRTEHATATYQRELQPTDKVIMNNEYATLILTGYEDFEYLDGSGYIVENETMLFYLINKTNQTLLFEIEKTAMNGKTDEDLASVQTTYFVAHSSGYFEEHWNRSTLRREEITCITEAELLCKISTYENRETLITERILLTP